MKVLGIDPGTRILGYAVLESDKSNFIVHTYGAISPNLKKTLPQRLKEIYAGLIQAIEKYKPDVAVVEKAFYGKNIQTAIRIGEARGIAFLAAANMGLTVYQYDPTKIKKSVVGTGNAHKSQIQYMLKNILQLPEIPGTDAADAIAIAFCHCQQLQYGVLLKEEEE